MAESFPKQMTGGKVTVTTAGTPVQFPSVSIAADQVILEADPRGTAKIGLGGAGLVMSTDTNLWSILVPGGTAVIAVPDLRAAGLWVDADANGAKLFYWVIT